MDFILIVLLNKSGPFSIVRKCYHRESREIYAVKIVDIEKFVTSPGLSIDGECLFGK